MLENVDNDIIIETVSLKHRRDLSKQSGGLSAHSDMGSKISSATSNRIGAETDESVIAPALQSIELRQP